MKKLSRVFNALFFLSLSVWFLFVLHHDTTHPETWCDWKHDPRWSAPSAALLVPLLVWMFVLGEREWRRDKRNARLDSMIKTIKALSQAGRREEAEKAGSLYHRVKAAGNQREEDRLAKQFSDLYQN